MGKEKKVKIMLISIVLGISVLFLILGIVLNKKEKKNETPIVENKMFEDVTDYNIFFSVEANINKYVEAIIEKDNMQIYNLLNTAYITKNKITANNILTESTNFTEGYFYKISEVKSFDLGNNIVAYYSIGNIMEDTLEGNSIIYSNVSYLLFINYNNQTISIYPLEENEDYEEIIKNFNENYYIKENNYNSLEGIDLIDLNSICLLYLSDFISSVSNDVKIAYKKTINFPTQNDFEQYIKENELSSILSSCSRNNTEENRIYYVRDENGNRYTFKENKIMDYSVAITK